MTGDLFWIAAGAASGGALGGCVITASVMEFCSRRRTRATDAERAANDRARFDEYRRTYTARPQPASRALID